MAFSPTIDRSGRAGVAIRHDRPIKTADVFPGIVAGLYRNWRREDADQAELRQVDPKDLGYPAAFTGRACLAAPGALAKYGFVGFALLVGLLALGLLQQS